MLEKVTVKRVLELAGRFVAAIHLGIELPQIVSPSVARRLQDLQLGVRDR
jgi:hypothetical protein